MLVRRRSAARTAVARLGNHYAAAAAAAIAAAAAAPASTAATAAVVAAAADVQIPSYSKLRGASLLSGSQNNDRKYHRIFFYYCSVLCLSRLDLPLTMHVVSLH